MVLFFPIFLLFRFDYLGVFSGYCSAVPFSMLILALIQVSTGLRDRLSKSCMDKMCAPEQAFPGLRVFQRSECVPLLFQVGGLSRLIGNV
jgi:hypothetical protein